MLLAGGRAFSGRQDLHPDSDDDNRKDFVRLGLAGGTADRDRLCLWRWSLRDDAAPALALSATAQPTIGKYVQVDTAQFASTLAILMDAGVPLLRC